MAQNLDADLNIISQSDIEIQIDPLTKDLSIIAKLDDEPNDVGGLSAAELKAKFDEAGNTIKDFINNSLIPQALGDGISEKQRQANETARQTAETARQTAETARASAEAARETAESGRVSAEEARETAEAARAAAETSRQTAETARESAEAARNSAEAQRQTAEEGRGSAEAVRQGNETARQSAETARQSAESARASAETARGTVESGRVSAESARASAETARASAETARQTAESARAAAETERQEAEAGREAEDARRTEQLNTWIDGVTAEAIALPATSPATAEAIPAGGSVRLSFGIPAGPQGPKGDTGPAGPQGPKGDGGGVPENNPVFTGSISMGREEGTTATEGSVATGFSCEASGRYSHAEGASTTASNHCSHAEGDNTTASGTVSHAEGQGATASGKYSHAEGVSTTASSSYSHAEGCETTTKSPSSHAEGYGTTASGWASHAEGHGTTASNTTSHAEGDGTTASNYASHAGGMLNKAMTDGGSPNNTVGDVMVLGNGTLDNGNTNLSNCFRVTYAGEVYGLSAFNSSGADYAEFFEWADGNPDAEDRAGYFVTLEGRRIRPAKPGDYILGVVSGQPCIIGNADEDWLGRWVHDEFGRFVPEYLEEERTEVSTEGLSEEEIRALGGEPDVKEQDGKLYRVTSKVVDYETPSWRHKANPDYDPAQKYVERKDRPEWSAVGMLGVLSVRDDGTCLADGFCRVAEGGIAAAAEAELVLEGGKVLKGYRVLERVSENVVRIVFR